MLLLYTFQLKICKLLNLSVPELYYTIKTNNTIHNIADIYTENNGFNKENIIYLIDCKPVCIRITGNRLCTDAQLLAN